MGSESYTKLDSGVSSTEKTLQFLLGQNQKAQHPVHAFFIHSTKRFRAQWFLRLFNLYGIDFDLFNLICAYSELAVRDKKKWTCPYRDMDDILYEKKVSFDDKSRNLHELIVLYAKENHDEQKKKYLNALLIGLFEGFLEHEKSPAVTAKYKKVMKRYIEKHDLQYTIIATNKASKAGEVEDNTASYAIYDRYNQKNVNLGKKSFIRRRVLPAAKLIAKTAVMSYSIAVGILIFFGAVTFVGTVFGLSVLSFGTPLAIIAFVGLVGLSVLGCMGLYHLWSGPADASVKDILTGLSDLTTKQKIAWTVLSILSFFTALVMMGVVAGAIISAFTGVGLPIAGLIIAGVLGVTGVIGLTLVMMAVSKGFVTTFSDRFKQFLNLWKLPKDNENIFWHYAKALIITLAMAAIVAFGIWAFYVMYTQPWFQALFAPIMTYAPSGIELAVTIGLWVIVSLALPVRFIYNISPTVSLGIFIGKVIVGTIELAASTVARIAHAIRHPIDDAKEAYKNTKEGFNHAATTVVGALKKPLLLLVHAQYAVIHLYRVIKVSVVDFVGAVSSAPGVGANPEVSIYKDDVLMTIAENSERNFSDIPDVASRDGKGDIHTLADLKPKKPIQTQGFFTVHKDVVLQKGRVDTDETEVGHDHTLASK